MSQRFTQATPSGVYRAGRAQELLHAAQARGLYVAHIELAAGATKAALLQRLAAALGFPAWFGGNWDALEDCLQDLSWLRAPGWLIVLDGCDALEPEDLRVLTDILVESAAYWIGRDRWFYAVLVPGPPSLPDIGEAQGS
jgi:hypothetical protein